MRGGEDDGFNGTTGNTVVKRSNDIIFPTFCGIGDHPGHGNNLCPQIKFSLNQISIAYSHIWL